MTIPVLYQDETLIAVDKPGGLLVHRSKQSSDRVALLQLVRDQVERHLYPVHRLDRPTSGVLVFGFGSAEARQVHDALKRPDTRKEYLALIRGSSPDQFESRRPLTEKEAWTEFEKLGEFSRCSLLRARLHTGRRHQIRRHLSRQARQIIGDTKYGKGRINSFFRENYGLPRLFLHAQLLEFEHPVTGERLRIRSPLAEDLREFLARLPDVDAGLLKSIS